jgi:hypothetical protein
MEQQEEQWGQRDDGQVRESKSSLVLDDGQLADARGGAVLQGHILLLELALVGAKGLRVVSETQPAMPTHEAHKANRES